MLVIFGYFDTINDGVRERMAITTELALHLLHRLDFSGTRCDAFALKGGKGRQHGKDDGADTISRQFTARVQEMN